MDEALIISRLSALAHPVRLRAYIAIVSGGEEGVAAGSVASHLQIRPNVLTPHLALLVSCGLVRREDRGARANLTANGAVAAELLQALEDVLAG